MWPLAGLALLALASASSRRSRGLGDMPALPSGDPQGAVPSGSEVWLVRPEDFAHPAQKAAIAARGEQEGARWVVAPASGWAGARPFATAKAARTVLKAAGFRGPYGHGQSSRWVK